MISRQSLSQAFSKDTLLNVLPEQKNPQKKKNPNDRTVKLEPEENGRERNVDGLKVSAAGSNGVDVFATLGRPWMTAGREDPTDRARGAAIRRPASTRTYDESPQWTRVLKPVGSEDKPDRAQALIGLRSRSISTDQ